MTIEFTLSLEDIMTFQKYHLKNKSAAYKKRKMIFYPMLPFLLLILMIVNEGFGSTTIIINLIASVLWVLFFPVLFFRITLLKVKRRLRKLENKGELEVVKPSKMKFTEKGIELERKHFHSDFDWNFIKELEETNNFFYLYIQTSAAVILPKEISFNEEENSSYQEFVRNHLKSKMSS